MKNILSFCTLLLFATLLLFSCSKEDSTETVLETPVEVSPIKTIKVFAQDQESYALIDIFNPDFSDLTPENFKITAKYIDLNQLEDTAPNTNNEEEEEEDDTDATEILFSEVHLAEGFNTFEILFVKSENLRGKSPKNYDYDGHNGSWARPKTRCLRGVTGHPLNCNHTHWKVKKKHSGLIALWNTLYSATSYNSSTTIQYYDGNAIYHKWRVRIDPDNSCNAYSSFSLTWEDCYF